MPGEKFKMRLGEPKGGGSKLTIYVLDPTDEQGTTVGFALAPRPETLDGKVLGVINNGKRNAKLILGYLVELLKEEYAISEVKWVKKPSVSHPISPNLAKELQTCHLILSGVGD